MGNLRGIFGGNHISIELPISKKVIKLRPYKHGDLKSIYNATDTLEKNGRVKDYLLTISGFLGSLIDGNINLNDLHIADVVYIMTKSKEISKSEETSIFCECSKCKTKNEVIFKMEELQIVNNKKTDKIEFDEAVISMGDFTFGLLISCADILKEDHKLDEMSRFYAHFIKHIESGNQIYDNFTVDDVVRDIIDNMSMSQIKEIKNYISNEPNLYWKKDYTCSECGKEGTVILDKILDFFSIS